MSQSLKDLKVFSTSWQIVNTYFKTIKSIIFYYGEEQGEFN